MVLGMFFLFGENTKNQFALLIINHRTNGENTGRKKIKIKGGQNIRSKNIQFTSTNATDPRRGNIHHYCVTLSFKRNARAVD